VKTRLVSARVIAIGPTTGLPIDPADRDDTIIFTMSKSSDAAHYSEPAIIRCPE